jgi:ribosomal protein L29
MTLPKYKELEKLKTINEIEEEIITLQKNIVKLKLKRIGKTTSVSPHQFRHFKRRIRQLEAKAKNFEILEK